MEEIAERFLQELLSHRVDRGAEPDRARFHRLVGTAAAYWLCHPRTALKLQRTKHTITLSFEGPVSGKQIQIFSFRVHFPTQEYRFFGTPETGKSLPPGCGDVLERIRSLTQAYLGSTEGEPVASVVTVVLKGERMPDILPLVDETRRTLDGGNEVAVVPNQQSRKALAQQKPVAKPSATSPAAAQPAPTKPAAPTPPSAPKVAAPLAVKKPDPPMETPAAVPTPAPEPAYVMLACPKPADSAAFHAKVFQQKAVRHTRDRHYVEIRLGSLLVAFQDDLSKEERKLYGFGPVERHRGWGAIFMVRVTDFDACLRRVKKLPGALVREDAEAKSFVLRDPAGYLFEITPR